MLRDKKSMGAPLALAISVALGSGGAHAQENEPALEEITVTARKIEENLQDAPLSVTAFTGDLAVRAGLRDITELSFLTPGLSMQNNSRINEQPFIRGMSVNSFFRPTQLTSSFIDGIYVQGLGRTVDLQTEMQRVEVVRGPQAALYGRATFAGAINYITKTPGDELELDTVLTAGQNGRYESSLYVAGPLIEDTLSASVNLRYNDYESQFRDASSGNRLGDQRTKSVSSKWVWTPTDRFTGTFRIERFEIDDGHSPNVLIGADQLNFNAGGTFDVFNGVLPVPPDSALDINTENIDGGARRLENDRAHLILEWDFDAFTFGSYTHMAEQKLDYFIDGDNTNTSAFGGLFESRFAEDFDDFSQDFRLTSNTDAPTRWIAGVYYYDGEYQVSQLESNVVFGNPRLEESMAIYGSVEFDLSDSLSLSLDARYQDEKIQRESSATGDIVREATTTSFLPRAILNYEPTDDTLLYVSASKGNQPADFNTAANTPPEFENVDEQEIWSYELGWKQNFGDRYRLAAAAYFIDWDGQLSRFVTIGTNGDTANLNINAGNTEILGFEGSFEAALADGLSLMATYAYNDAEYQRFDSVNCERAFGDQSCDGKKVQNVPENQFSLSVNYDYEINADWDGYARIDYSYRDEQFVDEINLARAPSVTLVNARAGFDSGRYGIDLWVRNLTDEDSPDFATRFLDLTVFPFNTGYQLALRTEREFGVTFRYSY